MWKIINLTFEGNCNCCGLNLPKGTRAIWKGRGKDRVICLGCVECEAFSPCKTNYENPFQEQIKDDEDKFLESMGR